MRAGSSQPDKSAFKSKEKLASSQSRSVRRRNQDTQRNTAVATPPSRPSGPTLRPKKEKTSSVTKNMLPLALRSNLSSVVTTIMSELSSASSSASTSSSQPSSLTTGMAAALYVLSGVMQPLLVTLADQDGLADKSCQLYMMFYYLGPASVTLSFCPPCNKDRDEDGDGGDGQPKPRPKTSTLVKAASIALIDIVAQSLNYTGSILAGPTIFAIIYSSVTVWTALFSRCLLGRRMNEAQWAGVLVVFGGLALAAVHATSVGQGVFVGSCLVIVGSAMHASTYVLSEMVMTRGCELSVRANCSLQGMVALCSYLVWQLVYTMPRWEEKIGRPMREAGTTVAMAMVVLLSIALANLIHAVTFFHTLRHFPSGATSAGVMKGLQAVLVFAATSVAFCGNAGTGTEMCFNGAKLVSLCVVLVGVMLYGRATEMQQRRSREGKGGAGAGGGYSRIGDADDLQV